MNLWQVSFRKVAVSYIFLLRHWHTEYPFFLHFLDVFVKIFVLFFGTNEKFRIFVLLLAYIIHSGFISGYQNRYGDNLKPPTNVYHRMTA